jgi:hypothetical protein
MSETLPLNGRNRHYTGPSRVATNYRDAIGAVSQGAAHQRAIKVTREFFKYLHVLRANGHAPTVTRLFELFCDEMDQLPTPTVVHAIRKDGHTDRAQDEAREECLLDGMTYSELQTLKTRTSREISDKLMLNRAITAHMMSMPLELR